jgi:hypothetical protein
VGKIEATENSKSKNVGNQRQMGYLRALWLPKLLLLRRVAFQEHGNGERLCAPSSSCASQHRPAFFDQHCASKDYDGCDNAYGFERMRPAGGNRRVTVVFEPPSNAAQMGGG